MVRRFKKYFSQSGKQIATRVGMTFFVTFAIHTYIMAVKLDGFKFDSRNPWSQYVATDQTGANAVILWFMVALLFWMLFDGIKKRGLQGFFQSLLQLPKNSISYYRGLGHRSSPIVFFGAGGALVLTAGLGRPTFLFFALSLLVSFVSVLGDLLVFLFQKLEQALAQVLQKKYQVTRDLLALLMMSASGGLFLGYALVSYHRFVGIFLIAVGFYLVFSKKKKLRPSHLIFFLLVAAIIDKLFFEGSFALADDGGWTEAGGTWSKWLRSGGFSDVLAHGVAPSLSASMASFFSAAHQPGEFHFDFSKTTWDPYTTKNIQNLHPDVQQRAYDFVNKVQDDLGYQMRINDKSNYRTWAEQDALYGVGRDSNGNKIGDTVTNSHGGESWHNYGTAFDAAPIKDGGIQKLPLEEWKKVQTIAADNGFNDWGGNWSGDMSKDLGHFGSTYGNNVQDFKKKFDEIQSAFPEKSEKEISKEVVDWFLP